MKSLTVAGFALSSLLLAAACSLPQVGLGTSQKASPATSLAGGGSSNPPTVTNDPARGVALYTSPAGTTEEIDAIDPSTGTTVKCADATGFAVVDRLSEGGQSQPEILVVGDTTGGGPGVWQIDPDGTISLVALEGGARRGDLTPDADHAPEHLARHFGWSYHVTGMSSDGRMIIGYAENLKGFSHGPISIPAGATVAVYWRAILRHNRDFRISPPRVIGTMSAPTDGRPFHFDDRSDDNPSRLTPLLFGRLSSYLVTATAVAFDATGSDYVVTGTDQNGKPAQATIASDGTIVITEVTSTGGGTTSYSEIVIDTFNPTGPGNGFDFDVLGLFSPTGVTSSANPWTSPCTAALACDGQSGIGSNPNSSQPYFAYIDYKPATPLPSGTVLYLRISGYSPSGSSTGSDTTAGAYGIRVLTSPSSSYTYFSSVNTSDSPYEPDDTPISGGVPTNPASITLGSRGLNRYLTVGDVDWVKIVLP